MENMKSREELFTGNNYNIIQAEAHGTESDGCISYATPVRSRIFEKPGGNQYPLLHVGGIVPEPLLPASEVMTKIIQDLQEARILLNEDPVKTEGGLSSGNAGESSNFLCYRALRLNYYAVTGLLAVYACTPDNGKMHSIIPLK